MQELIGDIGVQTGELLGLIELIYDAALDPAKWQGALAAISDALHSSFASLVVEDMSMRLSAVPATTATEDLRYDEYNKTAIHISPLHVPIILTKKACDVFTTSDVLGEKAFRASLFHEIYVKPHGYLDALMGILVNDPPALEYIIVTRKVGMNTFSQADYTLLGLLMPHVQRAYQISRIFADQKAKIESFQTALDGLQTAAFIVRTDDRVLHFNHAARHYLAPGGPLALKNDLLLFNSPALRDQWAKAKAEVLNLQSANGRLSGDFVLEEAGGEKHLVHLLPLSPLSAAASEARLAMFIRKAEVRAEVAVELVARRFRLTAREMSVLVAVVQTGDSTTAAHVLGIGLGTLKTHLKRIYAKTDTDSHLDLARLLMQFQPAKGS